MGLPQTGKKTLFQVLTGSSLPEQTGATKAIPGTAEIHDDRFDRLVERYGPKKDARARIDLVLLPKMEQESIARGDIFRDISDVDALCHVVRAFGDESIYHASGSVDPLRDVEMVNAELLMHDQIFVEKRIERLETSIKKIKDDRQLKELELMQRIQAHLEEEKPLRLLSFSDDEDLLIRSYPLITRKELILDSEEERREFLDDLGIAESALEMLTKLCLQALGRISFFTVGKDEVRQWLVRVGASAPVAAGVIHSDLQKGFIRAEVMKYDELMACGSEAELKKAGKMYVQGKDYIVVDGDILNIRFNV
jgi:ribosome-binding ATPase YchF (GTP1/OBG family)